MTSSAASSFSSRARGRISRAIVVASIVVGSLTGCAAHIANTPPPAIKITVEMCGTDQDYYHTSGYGGGGVVVFKNNDKRVRRIVFPSRWPFRGLSHTIVLHPGEQSHEYRIDQFANHKAAQPDTFLFQVKGDLDEEECGKPPGGPGVIVEGG